LSAEELQKEARFHTDAEAADSVADAIRKAVDDIVFDLYGEENPRQLEEYQKTPKQGMTMGGIK